MSNEILKDEILNEEELDQVVGGSLKEVSLDREFLRDIGFNIEWKNTDYIYNYFDKISTELRNTWSEAGVLCKSISNGDYTKNVYTDKSGNVISREDAMKKAMAFKGVTDLDLSKYGIH